MRVTWMYFMEFSVFDHFVVGLIYSPPPFKRCICALILEDGGVPTDAENSANREFFWRVVSCSSAHKWALVP